jgi:hypothetical protein
MKKIAHRPIAPVALTMIALSVPVAPAHAQWTDDPAANTPIVVKPGTQDQVKLAHRADGSTYVSWFDNSGSGFDVYLQRIDADGNRLWNADGVLIADRSYSSTEDYGLSVDGDGYAWMVFRDDRFGGTQITAQRIAPDGTLEFGPNGVQLTDDGAFKASPQITAVDNNSAVAAWTHGSAARVARIDADGDILWTDILTPASLNYLASGVHSIGDGTAVVLLVNYGSFADPRRLHAQKFDANGNRQWADPATPIMTAGSLQIGNFPKGIATSDGGVIVAWYQSTPALQSYVQRLDASGSAHLPAGGLTVSTDGTQLRTDPAAAYDEANDDIYVFWRETNSAQSQYGVYGQRIDSDGNRAWGSTGLTILPLSSINRTQIRAAMLDGDAILAYNESPSFGQDTVRISRFAADGSSAWSPMTLIASSIISPKSRLALIDTVNNTAILAWVDERNGTRDIYAQQVTADGELGDASPDCAPADLNCDGVVNVSDLLLLFDAWGDCSDCDPGTCPADLNGDCVVNVSDLLILFDNWG